MINIFTKTTITIIISMKDIVLTNMLYYISLQLTVNGRNFANGVPALKHVEEESNYVQDPSRHKQKMVEMLVLGVKLRRNPVKQILVQVNMNFYQYY